MPTFTETKRSYDAMFEKLNARNLTNLQMLSFESHGTTCSGTTLVLRASDEDGDSPSVDIRFDGVGYISLPTSISYFEIKLAQPADSRPIETDLSYKLNPPIWVVCVEVSREGGAPAKYFIAAERVQING